MNQIPKTAEDLRKVRQAIVELIQNPYADYGMIKRLNERLEKVDKKILELEGDEQQQESQ